MMNTLLTYTIRGLQENTSNNILSSEKVSATTEIITAPFICTTWSSNKSDSKIYTVIFAFLGIQLLNDLKL